MDSKKRVSKLIETCVIILCHEISAAISNYLHENEPYVIISLVGCDFAIIPLNRDSKQGILSFIPKMQNGAFLIYERVFEYQ